MPHHGDVLITCIFEGKRNIFFLIFVFVPIKHFSLEIMVSPSSSSSLVGPLLLAPNNGYKIWEDPSFIKWRKRDPHVHLQCHESVQGHTP
jgi:hypothetical protein